MVMPSKQTTLSGEPVSPPVDSSLDDIQFVYYESNVEPVLNSQKPKQKSNAVELAITFFDQASVVDTDSLSEDDLSALAEEFVDFIFDSVWQQVDGAGYSLWIQIQTDTPEMMREYPVYIQTPVGTFCSSFNRYSGTNATSVSDEFLKAVGQLVSDSDDTNGWGNASERLLNQLNETETKFFVNIRNALIGQLDMSTEIALLIEKGKRV